MQQYLNLIDTVLSKGKIKHNRTGVSALTVAGAMLEADLQEGFPLLTTKKMPFKTIAVELEGFLKAITSKQWYQERGCNIWNEWCNPEAIPENLSEEERKDFQYKHDDLGPIYGYQWTYFNRKYPDGTDKYDQLHAIRNKLILDPNDRRMLCSAWNPLQMHQMALPPCHVAWHLVHVDGTLNLTWYQRSCDLMLGIPFNLASYALLLQLLCDDIGFKAGTVTGFFSDLHIYKNHIEAAKLQLTRKPKPLPTLITNVETSIYQWSHDKVILENYQSHPRLQMDVAI